jgi:glycolate oxidase iron-sulfur subunit
VETGPVRPGWEKIYEKSLDCVHCGLCLQSCPTYRVTGRETSSPRGRIYLMRGVAERRIEMRGALADEAYLCLGCRACETACPSGVEYGHLVELTRSELTRAGERQGLLARLERLALRHVVARRAALKLSFDLLRVVQRLKLDRLVAPLLPGRARDAQALLPAVPRRSERALPPEVTPAVGARRGRVGFLAGCVMSELFSDINAATLRVLARNGFEVVVPREQGCCGALHAHAGDSGLAADLARHNARVFSGAEVDVVITNSAGCGAAMRDAGHWIGSEGETYASRVRDVCEWLDAQGLVAPDLPLEKRVCYDDPCHLVHGQGVGAAPRRLLEAIPELELVAHDDPGACCGAAGTYNLTQPEMSAAVLASKLDSLSAAAPDIIATGNPGCLMQLRSGAAKAGLAAEVLHPVELLDRAYS